jgi:hypothetical protein
MPLSDRTKNIFNSICFEYNNNDDINKTYNMLVELLTLKCNQEEIVHINEFNHLIQRFYIKNNYNNYNNNNIETIKSIIEDFLTGEQYKKLRNEFC